MSMATMFGPPLLPITVQALDNRRALLPGMTMGFVGYAIGTYPGIAAGLWLEAGDMIGQMSITPPRGDLSHIGLVWDSLDRV